MYNIIEYALEHFNMSINVLMIFNSLILLLTWFYYHW